jgi:hypothetical protein
MEEKRCSRCKEIKPYNQFYIDNHNPSGRQSFCKPCRKDYTAERRAQFKKSHGISKAQYHYKTNSRYRARQLLAIYKRTDESKGITGKYYSIDELNDVLTKGSCIYCGDRGNVGLDRIDNKGGHTKDNVVTACGLCNKTRNANFTHTEMFILGKAIRKIKAERGIYA